MLTLERLRDVRIKRGLEPKQLATLSGISVSHLRKLELTTRGIVEPWFHQAAVLAQVLNVGICDLMPAAANQFAVGRIGKPMPTDLDVWRSGLPMDLPTACRITVLFGLTDPLHLIQPPIELAAQLWTMIATGERTAELRTCPWCDQPIVDDTGHLPACLPNNLWGPRHQRLAPNVGFSPTPRHAGSTHGVSGVGTGLKRIRSQTGKTQAEFATLIGMGADHYAKTERGDLRITMKRAEVLANKLGIDMAGIFHV